MHFFDRQPACSRLAALLGLVARLEHVTKRRIRLPLHLLGVNDRVVGCQALINMCVHMLIAVAYSSTGSVRR